MNASHLHKSSKVPYRDGRVTLRSNLQDVYQYRSYFESRPIIINFISAMKYNLRIMDPNVYILTLINN